ncbi:MAG: sigma-70 family RNA polymerase sigma factor [Polyangia bacterium]|nr:sigma-70 family RNA polymerase sigma factor [Polyangia bacterium]
MGPSDADLIARVLSSDDRHAFATLVRRHQSAVRGLLRRLTCGQGAIADDLAQETFLRAYRSLASFRGGARFSTWLHSIAYHLFLNELRRRRPEVAEAPEPSEPSTAGRSLLRHDLSRAMEDLRPEERLALALAFGQDYSHQEVAEILGCPLGTVKTHIARGKDKLKARLGAWETRGPGESP